MNVGSVRAVQVEEAAHRHLHIQYRPCMTEIHIDIQKERCAHQLRPREVVQQELVAEILGDFVDLQVGGRT